MSRFTVAKVRTLTIPGRYGDGDTLFLVVAPRGSKFWVQRLTVHGPRRDVGLGGFLRVRLAEARGLAFDNRCITRAGGDPIAERRRGHAPTFEEATQRTLAGLRPKGRNAKHESSWLQTLEKYAFPAFGSLRVDRIGRKDVLDVVEPIWGIKQETARRVRQRIRAVLAWCQAREYIDINVAGEVIDDALVPLPASQNHMWALPYAELPEVLRLLVNGRGSDTTKLCFRFTVLTAARGNESRLAPWSEIDIKGSLWRLPPNRMKANKEHNQPLSVPALEVLDQARSLDDGSGSSFRWRRIAASP